jgi:4-carboxymuconolactone decarboxylase
MARLPYVDPASAPEEVRNTLEKLPAPLNIFRMLAHAETNLRPVVRLGASILAEQKLDARLRELAILQVGRLAPARYEWVQHVPIAKLVGVSNEQIDALERGDETAAVFDDDERLVLRAARELVRDVRPSDDTFAALERGFSPREIVELILAVGYYAMLARLMETVRIDIDPPMGDSVWRAARP